ncbi:MAG: hypothetical protein C0407_12400 [Desulfobacca sp.]|nr:hypothetical protein [Desulfobacca sp.]
MLKKGIHFRLPLGVSPKDRAARAARLGRAFEEAPIREPICRAFDEATIRWPNSRSAGSRDMKTGVNEF